MKEGWTFPLPGWAAGEGKRGPRFFGLGEVRLAVLSLIAERPQHGYELMKEFGARLGSLYHASSGTVYPALKQLEKEKLIEFRMEAGRKIYRLTKDGRKHLSAEAGAVQAIWNRATEFENLGQQMGPHTMAVAGPLNELYMATLRAANWSGGDPDREDQVRGILRRAAGELSRVVGGGRSGAAED